MRRLISSVLVVLAMLVGTGGTSFADTIAYTQILDATTGRQWRQLTDTFGTLTWNDVNALCPGGVCAGGWTWASSNDVKRLFNEVITGDPNNDAVGGAAGVYLSSGASTWAPFFLTRFNPTLSGEVAGWTSTLDTLALIRDAPSTGADLAYIQPQPSNQGYPGGIWMYQDYVIPEPATLLLLGTGLISGAAAQRRQLRRHAPAVSAPSL